MIGNISKLKTKMKGRGRMRLEFRVTKILIIAVLTLAGMAGFAGLQAAEAGSAAPVAGLKTLNNLMAAYDGESNAHARYLEFAKKADEEGYGAVASLFRAAANAEAVHAKYHANVIKKLGGTPKADVKAPEVKTTKENLEAALKGESYERDVMYPDFIKAATEEKQKKALRGFNLAKNAEAGHAEWYSQALANLEAWKGGKKDFFVCQECGLTLAALPAGKCPLCFAPVKKYMPVN